MGFTIKFLLRIIANGAALWVAKTYFEGFVLTDGYGALVIGAGMLAALNLFVRPVLRLLTTPIRWLTIGLFNFVINVIILWLADLLLPSLMIHGFTTLFFSSILIGLANIFF